jgi:ribosomal protein S18 acetylase RimI-like enzyme
MTLLNPMRDLTLRAASPPDAEFLFDLKRQALGGYVAQTWGRWDEQWQRHYFQQHFEPAQIQIILVSGQPVGMLSVVERLDRLELASIEILPAYQNRGIGSFLLKQLLERAGSLRVPVHLQVLKVNPARKLYERLGFRAIGQTETHLVMETAAPR